MKPLTVAMQMTLAMMRDRGAHYFLEAFVGHTIEWVRSEGVMDFAQIFTRRPDNYRFAILREVGGGYITADMYNTHIDTEGVIILGEMREFPDLDAAVMAAQLSL